MDSKSFTLACAVGSVVAIGVVALDSALVTEAAPARVRAHGLALALGVGLAAVTASLDYRHLRRHGLPWVLLGLSLVALVLVLVPGIGERINGARRWFRFGGQPSEFAKLAVIVWVADYAARHLNRMASFRVGFLLPLTGVGAAAALIFVEQDWGTALLVLGVGATVLAMAGTRAIYLGAAGLAGLGLLAILVRQDPLRWARLVTFLDPERHQHGVGWQQWQSLLSLGTGGLCGTFFGGGRHKFGFVPEQPTDFVFSLVGEELGLWGTLLVLGLFLMIFGSGLAIAWGARDPFGRLLAGGLTSLITFQALVNVGVVTCLLPNKGIPLPFLSYGCSDLICMFVAVGLLLSIARRSPIPSGHEPPPGPPEDEATRARRAALQALPLDTQRRRWWQLLGPWLRRSRAQNAFAGLHKYQRPPRSRRGSSGTPPPAPEAIAVLAASALGRRPTGR